MARRVRPRLRVPAARAAGAGLIKAVGPSPADYVQEAEERAIGVRARLGLGSDAIGDVFEVLGHLGVDVVRWPMGDDGPDGFYVRKADLAIIVVNSDKRLGRQRFTASHELAHHLFDRRSQVDGDVLASTSIPERRANAFAAFFLMPHAGVGRWLDEERRRQGGAQPRIDAEVVVHLVQHFGLSYEATLHQLRDLGRLRPTEVRELRAEQPERTARRLGYDVEAEVWERHRRVLPRGFVRRAFAAYGDGHISLARLAELLRTSEAEAHELAGEAGIELAEPSLDELEDAGRA